MTHLLFADDSLLLLKVDERSADHLRKILELYEDCSGQMINLEKSSIMFSKKAGSGVKEVVTEKLNIVAEAMNEKYLGLPIYIGRSKSRTLSYIKDRIWKKI